MRSMVSLRANEVSVAIYNKNVDCHDLLRKSRNDRKSRACKIYNDKQS